MHLLRAVLIFGGMAAFLAAQPPPTPKRPVTDTYHGVQVTDDYRWLEDFSDPAVRSWSEPQNAYARKYLDGLSRRAAWKVLDHTTPRCARRRSECDAQPVTRPLRTFIFEISRGV
jgi:hypothetical protein